MIFLIFFVFCFMTNPAHCKDKGDIFLGLTYNTPLGKFKGDAGFIAPSFIMFKPINKFLAFNTVSGFNLNWRNNYFILPTNFALTFQKMFDDNETGLTPFITLGFGYNFGVAEIEKVVYLGLGYNLIGMVGIRYYFSPKYVMSLDTRYNYIETFYFHNDINESFSQNYSTCSIGLSFRVKF